MLILARVLAALYGLSSILGSLWAFPSLSKLDLTSGLIMGIGALILALSPRDTWNDTDYWRTLIIIAISAIVADLIHIGIRIESKTSSLNIIINSEIIFLFSIIVIFYELMTFRSKHKL